MQNRSIVLLTAAWFVFGMTGCATTGLFKLSKNEFPKAGPKHPVSQIVGVWQPATGTGLENKTSRGFSGQILFFCQNKEQPVQVDGDVRIYIFDDQGTPEEQIQPLHEVNFEAKAWNQLLSNGPLGATYNVFVPYIRPGNHEAKCVLRVRYLPKGGVPAYSEMVNIAMEGKKKALPADAATTDYDAAHSGSPVSGKSPDLPAHAAASGRLVQARNLTETISVPDEARPSRARRHAVADLTEEERARIIREARARVTAETDGAVALVEHDGLTAERAPVAKKSAASPLPDYVGNDSGSDDWEETEAGEAADFDESSAPVVRRHSAAGAHLLDDERQIPADGHEQSAPDSAPQEDNAAEDVDPE